MSPSDTMEKKAELLVVGSIILDRGVTIPFPLSRSTAGPEVGTRTILLGFGATRVKLRVTRQQGDSPFTLVKLHDQPLGDRYAIMKGEVAFIDPVIPIRTPIHAPDQAFINIDARCRYHCLFCTSRDLSNYSRLSNEDWISMIRSNASEGRIGSIAITSGIPDTISGNIDDFVQIIEGVRDLGLPIGVEPYVETAEQLRRLHDAGATELKLNIQSWDPDIFTCICPDLDLDHIVEMLALGVGLFGRNRVCSNMLIGFGESDKVILDGVERLASMGVAVNLRRLHLNGRNSERINKVLVPQPIKADRLLRLRDEQQHIFASNGLDSSQFMTMCFPCGGCDLDPSIEK